jgi:ATP-dependent exoDNAse (exonuclease V) beta subunit
MSKNLGIMYYEHIEEALMCAIKASTKEIKEVAAALWPYDNISTAHQRLLDGLNPLKRQKLSMYEIIFICKFCDRYDPLYFMASECLHERPKRKSFSIEQEQIKDKLEELFAETTKSYRHCMKMLEQREEAEKIRDGIISFGDIEKKLSNI